MSKSYERDGLFGKHVEHTDESGKKTGESYERDGLFGKYVEHTGSSRSKDFATRYNKPEIDIRNIRYPKDPDTGEKISNWLDDWGLFGCFILIIIIILAIFIGIPIAGGSIAAKLIYGHLPEKPNKWIWRITCLPISFLVGFALTSELVSTFFALTINGCSTPESSACINYLHDPLPTPLGLHPKIIQLFVSESATLKQAHKSQKTDSINESFSAISFSESTGKYGGSWNYRSFEEAQSRAMHECGVIDCESVLVFQNSFGALAQSDDTWGGGSANTQAQAEQMAIQSCKKIASKPETCAVTLVISSNTGVTTRLLESPSVRESIQDNGNNLQSHLTENSKVAINGIGPIRVGMTVDEASQSANVHLIQTLSGGESQDCFYFKPEHGLDDVQFMVTQGHISRVDIFNDQITTFSGAKIGDSESRIMSLYPGQIQVQPHEYIQNGHYLIFTPKDRADQDYRVVFETDGDHVTSFRSGKIPEVTAVEGCL